MIRYCETINSDRGVQSNFASIEILMWILNKYLQQILMIHEATERVNRTKAKCKHQISYGELKSVFFTFLQKHENLHRPKSLRFSTYFQHAN